VIEGTGRRVVELELSAGQLRVARRRGLQHLVRADMTRRPVRGALAGVVVLASVHTNVDDVAPVFAQVERVLWPGGRLVFLGVHPCFVGHFLECREAQVVLQAGYRQGAGSSTPRTAPRTDWAAASGRGTFRWRSCSTGTSAVMERSVTSGQAGRPGGAGMPVRPAVRGRGRRV
jgi:SAM-dependent methyltransferase